MNLVKRILAVCLCVMLCVSMLPAAVFAVGEDEEAGGEQTEEIVKEEAEESSSGAVGQAADEEETPCDPPLMQEAEQNAAEPAANQLAEEPGEAESGSGEETALRVVFTLDPAETILTVCDAEGNALPAEPDGAYLLLPGVYTYDASCEGYVPLVGESFTVTAESTSVPVVLTAVVPQDDGEENDGEELAEIITAYVEIGPISFSDSGLADNDTLFASYVDRTLYPRPRMRGSTAGDRLSGVNAYAYSILAPEIKKVADGESSSTEFSILVDDMPFAQCGWTSAELGNVTIVSNGSITQEAKDALALKVGEMISVQTIMSALLADKPYDLYWFNKTIGVSSGYGISYDGTLLSISGSYSFKFRVAQEYALNGGAYAFDTSIGQSVQTTMQNAQSIVNAHASDSDQAKLESYLTEICARVDYNYAAVQNNAPYGNPWQLIWVFDNNPSTNVVCEGYSKAFQYLCDLSSFSEGTRCISVSGGMDGGTGAGAHMWNVVRRGDGKNYLVDVTNCDSGTIGYPDYLFLKRAESGDVTSGYVFSAGGASITYTYNSSMFSLFSTDDLTIPLKNEPQALYSGTCGTGVTWELYDNGELIIDGSGQMRNIGVNEDAPWASYADSITSVTVRSGVTRIGTYAFALLHSLEELTVEKGVTEIAANAFLRCDALVYAELPASLTAIGQYAFSACDALAHVSFGGAKTAWDALVSETYDVLKTTTVTYAAGDVRFSGSCGPQNANMLYWSIDTDWAMVLTGQGDMADYAAPQDRPWNTYCESITSLTLPANLHSIGNNAFYGLASIGSAAIPFGVTEIGESAFEDCLSLTEVTIPATVTSIGEHCFDGCESLSCISVASDNTVYSSCDGVLFDNEQQTLLLCPLGKTGVYTLPEGVALIGTDAFSGCALLTSVVIPEGVETIESGAFRNCSSLASVSLPLSLMSVDENAFAGCASLADVYYAGTQDDWDVIIFEDGNDCLTEASLHFAPSFVAHTLLLSGEIGVNFYMDLSQLSDAEKAASYMSFIVNGNEQADPFDAGHTNPGGDGYYGFTCYINSVQMADTITAVFHYGSGGTVTQGYSAKDYIDYVQEHQSDYSDRVIDMVNAIASYGTNVQPFLASGNGWTVDEEHAAMTGGAIPGNAEISAACAAAAAYAFVKDPGSAQVERITYSLDLGSKTDLNVFFKLSSGFSGPVSATLDGKPVNAVSQPDGRYRVTIPSIAAHELGTAHTIVFSAGGSCTVTVSALSYVYAALTSSLEIFDNLTARTALASLYYYYQAADSYINGESGETDTF